MFHHTCSELSQILGGSTLGVMPRVLPRRHVFLAQSRRLSLSWRRACLFWKLPCAPATCRQGAKERHCGPSVQTYACTHLCATVFCRATRGARGTLWRPPTVWQSGRFPCGSPPRRIYHPRRGSTGCNIFHLGNRQQNGELHLTVTSSWAQGPISQFFCFQNTQPSLPLRPHTRHPELSGTASPALPRWTKVSSKDSPALAGD